MINEVIGILEAVREYLTPLSCMDWTTYDHAQQLCDELDILVQRLKTGDLKALDELYLHFLPTSTFQEHSIVNNRTDQYLRLAAAFDAIYDKYKSLH